MEGRGRGTGLGQGALAYLTCGVCLLAWQGLPRDKLGLLGSADESDFVLGPWPTCPGPCGRPGTGEFGDRAWEGGEEKAAGDGDGGQRGVGRYVPWPSPALLSDGSPLMGPSRLSWRPPGSY